MTKKRRKSLNDTLAKEFVYGSSPASEPEAETKPPQPTAKPEPAPEPAEPQPKPEPTPELTQSEPKPKRTKKPSLMDKLQAETKESTKRFTIDLAESLHRKLSLLSVRSERSKADIVRILLEEALQDVDD